jgi:D-alanyl-D-alanine carboxypeptidase
MSSGNADYFNEEFLVDWQADPAQVYTLDELNSFVVGQPAQFAPGSAYQYTNANTNLLGAVVEDVTGQSYADALEERILQPLGQTDTRYLTDVEDWSAPHPVGYFVIDGVPVAQDENSSILGPAGSLFSTLDDGRVWAETLATGALLKPATQELRQIGHQIPKPPYDQYAVGMGETNGWWGHNGEGVGFTAATFHNPDTGASIVVYMNESDTPDKTHPADVTFRALAEVLANGAVR